MVVVVVVVVVVMMLVMFADDGRGWVPAVLSDSKPLGSICPDEKGISGSGPIRVPAQPSQ